MSTVFARAPLGRPPEIGGVWGTGVSAAAAGGSILLPRRLFNGIELNSLLSRLDSAVECAGGEDRGRKDGWVACQNSHIWRRRLHLEFANSL